MWLVFALLGFGTGAVVNILDKFIVSEKKIAPSAFTFYSTIFLLPLLLAIPFGWVSQAPLGVMAVALVCGISYNLALYTMYRSVQESEISHIGPFLGALIPLAVIILGQVFLHEVLTRHELVGAAFLIIGSLIISFQAGAAGKALQRSLPWAVMAAIFFAIYQVGSKYAYNNLGFGSGLAWVAGCTGLAGACLILAPSVRQALRKKPNTASKSSNPILIVTDKVLGVVMVLLVQYASSLGSVSLVNSLSGVQYGILVLLVAALSRFSPKLFREVYTRRELAQELVAVACIGLGLGLILFI
jgi:drug/metabolite transporter (DMT)-like permease